LSARDFVDWIDAFDSAIDAEESAALARGFLS
jgi:hypothetical protein